MCYIFKKKFIRDSIYILLDESTKNNVWVYMSNIIIYNYNYFKKKTSINKKPHCYHNHPYLLKSIYHCLNQAYTHTHNLCSLIDLTHFLGKFSRRSLSSHQCSFIHCRVFFFLTWLLVCVYVHLCHLKSITYTIYNRSTTKIYHLKIY